MKKTLAIILSLVMIIMLLPVAAFAGDGPKPYDPEDEFSAPAYIYAYELDSEGDISEVSYLVYCNDGESEIQELEDVSYDLETNTLTIDNLYYPELAFETNGMGDDFTVKVVGECSVARFAIWGDNYGGSVKFDGTGTIKINEDGYSNYAILANAENSETAITFGAFVTIYAYGDDFTVGVTDTTIEEAAEAIVFRNGEEHEIYSPNPYEQLVQVLGFEMEDPENLEEPQTYGFLMTCSEDPDGIYTGSVLDFGFDDPDSEEPDDGVVNPELYIVTKIAYCEEYGTYLPDFSAFDGAGMAFVLEDELEEAGLAFVLEDGEKVEFINENPVIMNYYTLGVDGNGNTYGVYEDMDWDTGEVTYYVYDLVEVEGFEPIHYVELNEEVNVEDLTAVTEIVEPEEPDEDLLYEHYVDEADFVYKGLRFPDVVDGNWYYDAAMYCAGKGFITGYKNGRFGAADALQRQDFVVILARIAGADLSAYEGQTGGLKDVSANTYYAPAVAWAVDCGIINGYQNGNFGVGDKITREQVATIFYRFMGSPDVDLGVLDAFNDNSKVSSFANEALAWAVANGIITGKNGKLAPTDSASRAEIATIVMRMDQKDMFAL